MWCGRLNFDEVNLAGKKTAVHGPGRWEEGLSTTVSKSASHGQIKPVYVIQVF